MSLINLKLSPISSVNLNLSFALRAGVSSCLTWVIWLKAASIWLSVNVPIRAASANDLLKAACLTFTGNLYGVILLLSSNFTVNVTLLSLSVPL